VKAIKRSVFCAFILVVVIILLGGCKQTPTPIIITQEGKITATPINTPVPTLTPTVEQVYAEDMNNFLEKFESWWNGPLKDWDTNFNKPVAGTNTTRGTVLFGIMSSKWTPPVYRGDVYENSDPQAKKMIDALFSFEPIAISIASEGLELLGDINSITPPKPINYAHERLSYCIEYKINWAQEIISYYETGILPNSLTDECVLVDNLKINIMNFIREYGD
jgi:hypothetical protein